MKINFLIVNNRLYSQEDWILHGINNLRFRNVEIELTEEQIYKIGLKKEQPDDEKIVQCQILFEVEND